MSKIIAIDAGHGSNTAGKRTFDGYREHWINVRCSYFFEKALKRCGFKTLRIGWDDTNSKDDPDPSITSRQNAIRAAGVDAVVSWHANHSGGKDWDSAAGVETFIHVTASKRQDSERLAKLIQTELVKGTEQKNRGVKTGNFGMCNATYMKCDAAALIEIGFMSNQLEAGLMKTDKFCREQAKDACMGLCKYYGYKYVPEFSSTSAAPAATKYRVTTNGARLALRETAGTSSDLIKYVSNGSVVVGTGKSQTVKTVKWLQVKVDGKTGWMHSGYLKKQ